MIIIDEKQSGKISPVSYNIEKLERKPPTTIEPKQEKKHIKQQNSDIAKTLSEPGKIYLSNIFNSNEK